MIVDGEMFWGLDSFGHLERHLRGEGVDVGSKLREWSQIPATAARREK